MNSRLNRLMLLTALTLVAVLCLAGTALAAAGGVKVSDNGAYVTYTGTSDVNTVTFGGSIAGHVVTITEAEIADPSATEDPSGACSLSGETLTCSDPDLYAASADMKDGDDIATLSGTFAWDVSGGADNDTLTGSDEAEDELDGQEGNDTIDGRGNGTNNLFSSEYLYGGPGNDTIRGGAGNEGIYGQEGSDDLDGEAGNDQISGGEDSDVVRGGPGDDNVGADEGAGERAEGGEGSDYLFCEGDNGETYDGGPGFDAISCFGSSGPIVVMGIGTGEIPDDFLFDLPAGVLRRTNNGPTTSSLVSVEDVYAGPGNDVVIGTDGPNVLSGQEGSDQIDGRGGSDQLTGGPGEDTLEANDAQADRADGGTESDTCNVDQLDTVAACEGLAVAAVPPSPGSAGGGDHTAPGCSVRSASGDFTKGQVTFNATCNEGGRVAADILARLKPGKVKFARVGDVIIGSKSTKVTAGKRVKLTLKLSKRYKRGLRKRARVRLVLRASDALGNQSVMTKSVRLK